MPRVLLVEDDAHAARAVREQLGSNDFVLVAEASTLGAGRDALAADRPDVVLLDLGLPDGSGLELIPAARALDPAPLVIVLTIFADDVHIFEALRAGAVGYLLKSDLAPLLVPALADAIAGGSPMSPGIARRVLSSFAAPPVGETPLTRREGEVTDLLARGCTYDEIGRALGVTTNTVRSFIRSIYEKLHVAGKAEAVSEALRRGLIRAP